MDAMPSETRDLVAAARERVRVGAVPDWIVPCPYDADFKEKVRGPVTHLSIEQQVHAEPHQTFTRVAARSGSKPLTRTFRPSAYEHFK